MHIIDNETLLKAYCLEHITLSFHGGVLTVSDFVIRKEQRNKGHGKRFLRDLTEEADRAGITLALTPSTSFGASGKRLRKLYHSFGFRNNKGTRADLSVSQSMIRTPKTNQ